MTMISACSFLKPLTTKKLQNNGVFLSISFQWNLVCGDAPLVPLIGTIFMGGVFFGAVMSGAVGDR